MGYVIATIPVATESNPRRLEQRSTLRPLERVVTFVLKRDAQSHWRAAQFYEWKPEVVSNHPERVQQIVRAR